MRRIAWIGLGLLAVLAGAALAWDFGFVGPYGPIPGGWLRGEVTPPPADWSFVDRVAEIQVETRLVLLPVWGPVSWSVITWVLSHEGKLYVPSRNCLEKRWVKNVIDHDDVRVRVDGRVYKARLVREEDPDVSRALLDQVLVKYLGIQAEDARPTNGGDPARQARAYGCLFRVEERLP